MEKHLSFQKGIKRVSSGAECGTECLPMVQEQTQASYTLQSVPMRKEFTEVFTLKEQKGGLGI